MVDVTDCDREPIHIPGTIQPFGVLFVLAEPSLTITQVSENVGDHLPFRVEEVLGRPLSTMMDPASVAEVREALGEERWQDMNPLQIGAHGRQFDGIVHRHEGAAILELEPNPGPPIAMHHPFRPALLRIQRVVTSAELADVVVQQMRRVTGFERVLFYRFHEDGHGSVDAEAKEPALEPYLGLHYPASDIPAQARELYRRNWLRLIFDASAKPARVVPTLRVDTGGPLDLSFSVLRSVSPIHLEYMANMGVRASMSISLIVRDRLWGLISCLNHTSPRRVSQETRMACEFLGRLTSLQIAALEDREQLAGRASRRATEDELARAMRESAPEDNVLEVLLTRPKELMGIVGAEGVALVSGGEIMTSGRTPPPALIQDIAAWVDEKEASRPFATASLGALFPRAQEASDVASGLLTFALPGCSSEATLVVPPGVHPDGELGRRSKQACRGGFRRSPASASFVCALARGGEAPFASVDGEQPRSRGRAAAPCHRSRHRAALLERAAGGTGAERPARRRVPRSQGPALGCPASNRGDAAPDTAAVMRRAQSALRGSAERIRRSAAHMKALTDDLLDLASIEAHRFALHLKSVESRELVEDALLAASPLAEAKRITLAVELIDVPRLEADPERIFRVLSNLLGNAIKFTPEGGTITVRAERRGDDLSIAVADTGPGIAADQLPHVFERYWKAQSTSQPGSGLGLYIANGIVEAHGGKIWAESSAGGARFTFILPLAR